MRSSATAIALGILLVACGASEPQQTTVVPISDESAATAPGSTTTTSTVPASTSTSMPASTSTVAEGDVPPELLALIGAPMPEVDLSFEGEEDAERWLSEFFRFVDWIVANPGVDEALASQAYVEGTPFFEVVEESLREQAALGVAVVGGQIEILALVPELGDFEIGIVSLELVSRRDQPMFHVNAGDLSLVAEWSPDPADAEIESTIFLQQVPPGIWKVVAWER